jgi:Zn-dependent peptidase ImmA (M78 family)/transcriptional regulator with XRE-family HTH domain
VIDDWRSLGEQLRLARDAAGFTQSEVAEVLGVSRPTVSQIEGGKVRVDSLTLRQLATLYRRPVDSFFGEAPPDMLVDKLVLEKAADVSGQDRAVLAAFLEFCRNLAWLRRVLERPSREAPPPRPVGPRTRRYAAEVGAKEERAVLGLGDAPIGERLFDLLEAHGLPVYRARLSEQRISGLLVNHPEAGPVIFVNASQYRWRQVFTAAHEYGHFLFHRSDQPVACRIFSSERGSGDITGEEFVNVFASEFLMPEDGIKRFLIDIGAAAGRLGPEEVIRLQRYFGVSFQAMLYRLLRLRLLSEADVQKMKDEIHPVALAWRLGYPVEADEFGEAAQDDELDLTRKFPREHIQLTLAALERGTISNGRAAELLELNRGAFDRFSQTVRHSHESPPIEEGLENVVA